jgi:hypothetical protein
MKQKLPASLEGILDKVQITFEDLERQEKRLLSLMKKRDEEIQQKLEAQSKNTEELEILGETDKFRSLKEVEVIDKLQNDTLKLVNDNLKNKITLIQFYSNTVLKKAEEGEIASSENSEPEIGLSDKAMEDMRKHIKFTAKK